MLELIDHKDVIRDLKFAPNGTMSLGNCFQSHSRLDIYEHQLLLHKFRSGTTLFRDWFTTNFN